MPETPYRKYKLYSPDASPDLTASGEYNSAVMAIDADIHGLGATDDELRKRLEAEEAAREQGDTDLWRGLTNESSVRKQADTALGERIDTEKSERTTADTTLGGRSRHREAGPASLRTPALGVRIGRREASGIDHRDWASASRQTPRWVSASTQRSPSGTTADTTLGGRIDTEKQARESADTAARCANRRREAAHHHRDWPSASRQTPRWVSASTQRSPSARPQTPR